MEEVERVQSGEIYMGSITYDPLGPLHSGRAAVYSRLTGRAFLDMVTFSPELEVVAARLDEAFWAYVSTGVIGFSAYMNSRPGVWNDNDSSQVAF